MHENYIMFYNSKWYFWNRLKLKCRIHNVEYTKWEILLNTFIEQILKYIYFWQISFETYKYLIGTSYIVIIKYAYVSYTKLY